jgi:hypothetical protein
LNPSPDSPGLDVLQRLGPFQDGDQLRGRWRES